MTLIFYRPILHGANRLHTSTPPLRLQPPRPPRIAIGTLNIRYGQGFGLVQAICAVEQFFYVMLLTKTKIQSEANSHNRLSYDVTCSTAWLPSAGEVQGGVMMVTR